MKLVTGLGSGFSVTDAALTDLEGKTIGEICPNGFTGTGTGKNHCAHFVSHVLGFETGATCRLMVPNAAAAGATLRVNELYLTCANRGFWKHRPPALVTCLAFLVLQHKGARNQWHSVVHRDGRSFPPVRFKHVGIHVDGWVWHYNNSAKQVVAQTIGDFSKRYASRGPADVLFGTLPPRTV